MAVRRKQASVLESPVLWSCFLHLLSRLWRLSSFLSIHTDLLSLLQMPQLALTFTAKQAWPLGSRSQPLPMVGE